MHDDEHNFKSEVLVSTIHNPVNFQPGDYDFVAGLDNRPPQYWGGPMALFEACRKNWEDNIKRVFPQWPQNCPSIHKCAHCGNGNVRFIEVFTHRPTGDKVVFGDICVERLGFTDHAAFAMTKIRSAASIEAKRVKLFRAKQKFLSEHGDFVGARTSMELTPAVHARNSFAHDILAKFEQYGELSARQVECFVNSVAKDIEIHNRRETERSNTGPVPTGKRVEFDGEFVSHKIVDGNFGLQHKMLIKLDNGSKIYLTMPTAFDLQTYPKGSRVKLRATVEASRDDVSFGFGRRPHLISAQAPMLQEAQ